MYTIDWGIFFLIILCNCLLFVITYFKIPNGIRRIYYFFTILPTVIYSGIGLSYKEINNNFLIKYLLYSSVLMITMFISFKSKGKSKFEFNLDQKPTQINMDSSIYLISKIGAIIFLVTYIIFLIIPEIRLYQIIKPPSPTVINIYERMQFNKKNTILDLAQLIRTFCIPLFMIFLYYQFKNGKKIKVILLILSWIYLAYLSVEYIGRYEMVIYVMFVFYVITMSKKLNIKAKFKQYAILATLFTLFMPLLLTYQYFRVGKNPININFIDAAKELLFYETDFPKYYHLIPNMIGQMTPLNYLLFFILLPIPSAIFKSKAIIIMSANKIFTTNILGLEWGQAGYSGLLPTIFGESILIFGVNFYLLHAILLGLLITSLCKLLEKKDNLVFCNIYFAVSAISIARGGSQGYFGLAINSLFAFFIFSYLIKLYKNKIS